MDAWDKNNIINIIGKYGCHQTTLCTFIEKDVKEKINPYIKFNFEILFETQLNTRKSDLVKEDPNFLDYKDCPIVFLTNPEKPQTQKIIIGSYQEFYKWLICNLGYYENRTEKDCEQETIKIKKNQMNLVKNKFCYLDLTNEGKAYNRVLIELFSNICPKTCQNFIGLCKGKTKNKMGETLTYEGTVVNRIVKNAYIQLGDMKRIGVKSFKSIYDGEFPDENYNVPHDTPGILGMVKKSGRTHSNECQFYITLSVMNTFDKNFVAFGRIIEGYDTLLSIQESETYLQRPTKLLKVQKCGEYIL